MKKEFKKAFNLSRLNKYFNDVYKDSNNLIYFSEYFSHNKIFKKKHKAALAYVKQILLDSIDKPGLLFLKSPFINKLLISEKSKVVYSRIYRFSLGEEIDFRLCETERLLKFKKYLIELINKNFTYKENTTIII